MNRGLKIAVNILVVLMIFLGLMFCIGMLVSSAGLVGREEISLAAGPGIDRAYFLVIIQIGIAAAVALGAGLVLFAMNIKKRIGALIGMAAFVVIGLIAYFGLADASTAGFLTSENVEISEDTSRWVSAGLNFFYALLFVAVLAWILGEILGFVKRLAK